MFLLFLTYRLKTIRRTIQLLQSPKPIDFGDRFLYLNLFPSKLCFIQLRKHPAQDDQFFVVPRSTELHKQNGDLHKICKSPNLENHNSQKLIAVLNPVVIYKIPEILGVRTAITRKEYRIV